MRRCLIAILFVGFIILLSSLVSLGQEVSRDSIDNKGLYVELQGGYAGTKIAPFWMRSNQYGSVPLEGASGSLLLRTFKDYKITGEWKKNVEDRSSHWDWGYALEGRANIGKRFQGQLIDAHVKLRFAMFEVRAGRSKDVMGLNGDTLLSSGNFAVSGNALGIPKFEISIPEYYRLPWLHGIFSFKGNFANGYMGKMEVNPSAFLQRTNDYNLHTLLHQKSLYARIGREKGKLQLFGGFNHQAQWGGEKERYGSAYDLNFLQTLYYVTVGKVNGGKGIPYSKIGNHQGSIDMGASYNFGNLNVMIYRQNIYDVGALSKLANLRDGLNGIVLTNNNYSKETKKYKWHKFLFEFFYSKDQAGYPWSKPTKSGDEDYYNNSEYLEGWSYLDVGIGTPLIVTAKSVRDGQANFPKDFFISNRVVAGHFGSIFKIYDWDVLGKVTYSRHYGTFATSEYGKSTGQMFHTPHSEMFVPVNQFSLYLRGERYLSSNTMIGVSLAIDRGRLLDNGMGALIHIRRVF